MAELDFGKLLGFRHVVAAARGRTDFAKAVGASLNKRGNETAGGASLAATSTLLTKGGEGPRADRTTLGAILNKAGPGEVPPV